MFNQKVGCESSGIGCKGLRWSRWYNTLVGRFELFSIVKWEWPEAFPATRQDLTRGKTVFNEAL